MVSVDWSFSTEEIHAIKQIISVQEGNPFVQSRWEKNVESAEISITEGDVWEAMLTALLTSQQRSGPDSQVFHFVKNEMETLHLDQCREANNVSQFVSDTLKAHGGIRYYNNIGDGCDKNLYRLDTGGWDPLWSELEKLTRLRTREPREEDFAVERQATIFLSDDLVGEGFHRIGPKQARNFLQILGLTRYEIPLDSRVTKWLNRNLNIPYEISGEGLNHSGYYHFIMDFVQGACFASDVLPCIFDAAVFSSFDTDWSKNDAEMIF